MLHEIKIWHIYKCPDCNVSNVSKLKFVVTVCRRKDSIWGFFINTPKPRLYASNPRLQKAQVTISPKDYNFLSYDSNIGCDDLKIFYAWELRQNLGPLKPETKAAILKTLDTSELIDEEKIQIIKANKDQE